MKNEWEKQKPKKQKTKNKSTIERKYCLFELNSNHSHVIPGIRDQDISFNLIFLNKRMFSMFYSTISLYITLEHLHILIVCTLHFTFEIMVFIIMIINVNRKCCFSLVPKRFSRSFFKHCNSIRLLPHLTLPYFSLRISIGIMTLPCREIFYHMIIMRIPSDIQFACWIKTKQKRKQKRKWTSITEVTINVHLMKGNVKTINV